MNATPERILHDVEQLPQQEQCELTAYLNQRLESESESEIEGEDADAAAAWESEIDDRVASVVAGTATLVPGDEFESRMATFISEIKAGKSPVRL